jgi:hypothetical protein
VRPDTHESGETAETGDPGTGLTGVEKRARDVDSLRESGLEVVTYAFTDEHVPAYTDTEGNEPLFHVIRPTEFSDPSAPRPVLIWLHGGVGGIDDDPEQNRFCTAGGVSGLVDNALFNHRLVLYNVKIRDWIMVVPETSWCDLWTGLGEADPVDTTHKSTMHVEQILDALEAGLDGITIDTEQVFAWGTSIGGSGVFPVSYGTGGTSRYAGVISDSGPMITSRWYNSFADGDLVTHVFGGDPYLDEEDTKPSEHWDNYTRVDASLLITERDYRLPIFSVFNTFDTLTSETHGERLEEVMEAHYGPEGVRYFSKNFNHHAPGVTYHTQTPFDSHPWGYINTMAFEFLSGQHVMMFEAEKLCLLELCNVVDEDDKKLGMVVSRHSDGASIHAEGREDRGTMFQALLPPSIPRDVPLKLIFAVDVTDMGSVRDKDPMLTFSLKRQGETLQELTLTGEGAITGRDRAPPRYSAQIDATTLIPDIEGYDAGVLPDDVSLTVRFWGRGEIYFDALWVLY